MAFGFKPYTRMTEQQRGEKKFETLGVLM